MCIHSFCTVIFILCNVCLKLTNFNMPKKLLLSPVNNQVNNQPSTLNVSTSNNSLDSDEITITSTIETDGRIYDKKRDPPGQKSIYILPGDSEKETYRLSTFMKFPPTIPINVCHLAQHGFLYTGYKDRVKCFSCGLNVQDWAVGDDAKSARWHSDDCNLVLGTETLNQPIGGRPVCFQDTSICNSKTKNIDSGFYSSTLSGQNSEKSVGPNLMENPRPCIAPCGMYNEPVTLVDQVPSTSYHGRENLTSRSASVNGIEPMTTGISMIQIGNYNTMTVHNNYAHSNNTNGQTVRQTARVVERSGNTVIQGLEIATIVSNSHRDLIYNRLDLSLEEDRRKSFTTWSCNYASVTVNALAKSGFFYLGNLDRVQCFSCSIVLRNWGPNDDVDREHQRNHSRCKMVLGTEIRNIALPWTPSEYVASNVIVNQPNVNPEEISSWQELFPCLYSVNPHMMSEQARLETFDYRWPKLKIKATKEQIAKAGYFFLGERDRTKCWYCNGGLQNWDPNDDPWIEHAKWFPGCEFLLSKKGVKFVMEVVKKFPNLRRPTLRNSRLDHRTGKLINSPPDLSQTQTKAIDSQSSQSAGSLLQNLSASSSQSQMSHVDTTPLPSTTTVSKMERDAENMGFSMAKIKRTIHKQLAEHGTNFTTIGELVDAILSDESEEPSDAPASTEIAMETTFLNYTPEEIKCANAPASSLKRNNEIFNENACEMKEQFSEETPRKVSKTGVSQGLKKSQELLDLENQRKCKACYKHQADTVVIPCGHLSICHDCSHQVSRCPVCRCKVQSVIKAYLA